MRHWSLPMSALRRPLLALLLAALQLVNGCQLPRRGTCPQPCARSPWQGVYPTIVTPVCNGQVDVAALEKQIQHALNGGVHGILVLGTIGEGEYVSPEQRAEVIATAVRVAN